MPSSELAAWHSLEEEATCLNLEEKGKRSMTDDAVMKVMKKVTGADNLEALSGLADSRQANCVLKMRSAGASLRQLSRLTGISMAIARRMIADVETKS